jgi:hypothetical protein
MAMRSVQEQGDDLTGSHREVQETETPAAGRESSWLKPNPAWTRRQTHCLRLMETNSKLVAGLVFSLQGYMC